MEARRILSALTSRTERTVLEWLARRMPAWVSSDLMTFAGTVGALMIGAGYALTHIDINFLWLSSFGLVVNWFGDSLDGTLARVRNKQRPKYGYYLDHTMDVINEAIMFIGAGLSPFFDMKLMMVIYILYLVLTLNVSFNAYLRSEFKITFAKMGPTEFRIIAIVINTVFLCIGERVIYSQIPNICVFSIMFVLVAIYIHTVVQDIKYYNKIDPMPQSRDDSKTE